MLKSSRGITLLAAIIIIVLVIIIIGTGIAIYQISTNNKITRQGLYGKPTEYNVSDNELEPNTDNSSEVTVEDEMYEKLLKGDFSGVEGEYVNLRGGVITLFDNGLLTNENAEVIGTPRKISDGTMLGNGTYTWDIREPNGKNFYRVIAPKGVNILIDHEVYDKDTTKIRLVSGDGFPTLDDIYYKR